MYAPFESNQGAVDLVKVAQVRYLLNFLLGLDSQSIFAEIIRG
jgi:hypothetical protein